MKNYLIIGGSSGIGKATAELLSSEGHQVTATYNQKATESSKVNYIFLNVDEDLDQLKIPDVLDGLVYCPGAIDLKPFSRIKPESFLEDFQLQVLGAIKVLQKAEKALKASQSASVVLFSTVAVQHGFNFHTKVSTSKGAIEGLVRALAAEWSPKVRVNAIAPSLTDTPLAAKLLSTDEKKEANAQRHPLKKIGAAHDIAHMVQFLLSEKSGWITGQVYAVDGGMSSLKV